jgi:hypothetical protein
VWPSCNKVDVPSREINMKTLKNYVRNMARPEASMAEGYIKDECIGFVMEYQ